MTSKDDLKRAACEAIDRHAAMIIDLGETILHHPGDRVQRDQDRHARRPANGARWGSSPVPAWR